MKYANAALAFGLGASAAVIAPRQAGCCFQINVSGGPGSGPVGQLGDGQNRVGPGYTAATYCLNAGGITDSSGRGCILTAPTTQFQCDAGASPTTGFTITSTGEIQFNGSGTFYECAVDANGVYNIYTTPGGTSCSPVTLTTAGGQCAAPPPVPTTTAPAPAPPQPTVTIVTTATAPGTTLISISISTAPGPTLVSVSTAVTTAPGATIVSTVPGPTLSITAPPQTIISTATVTPTGATCIPSSVYSSLAQTVTRTATTTLVSTLTQPAQTLTVTGPGATVTAPAQTVTRTETSVVVSTLTQPAQTLTVTGPGATVTAPAQTVTRTETTVLVSTLTQPAQTLTVTGPGATVTVPGPTVTVPGPTVTGPGATITVPGPNVTVPGPTITGPGATITVAGPTITVPGPTITGPGATITVAGPTITVPGPTVTGPGATITVPGPSVTVPGPTVTGPGATVTVSTFTQAVTNTVTKPSTPSSSACPADLSGNYEFPHLIVPVNSASPDTASGTSYFGQVSSTISTIFNFDIPASYSGHTCSLIFLLPQASELVTSSYTTSGTGTLHVTELNGIATTETTYANAPKVASDLGSFTITPGSSTVIATAACAAGQTLSYQLSATGSYALNYFQDFNPAPIGLYIREC